MGKLLQQSFSCVCHHSVLICLYFSPVMCCVIIIAGQVFSHHMVCGCVSLSHTLPHCPSCCHGDVLNGITLCRRAFCARFSQSMSLVGLRRNSETNRREILRNSTAPICSGSCAGCLSRHSDAWSSAKEVVMLIMFYRNDDELLTGCSGCHGRTWTVNQPIMSLNRETGSCTHRHHSGSYLYLKYCERELITLQMYYRNIMCQISHKGEILEDNEHLSQKNRSNQRLD